MSTNPRKQKKNGFEYNRDNIQVDHNQNVSQSINKMESNIQDAGMNHHPRVNPHVPSHVPSHVPPHVPPHVSPHVPSHVPSHVSPHVPPHVPPQTEIHNRGFDNLPERREVAEDPERVRQPIESQRPQPHMDMQNQMREIPNPRNQQMTYQDHIPANHSQTRPVNSQIEHTHQQMIRQNHPYYKNQQFHQMQESQGLGQMRGEVPIQREYHGQVQNKQEIYGQVGASRGYVQAPGTYTQPQMGSQFPQSQQGQHQVDPETYEKITCLLYTSPSPRDATLSRMPSSA